MKINNLKTALKKEFFIYLGTLFLLIIIAHSDMLSDPIARFELMGQKENYSHPIIYSFVIYFVIFLIRKVIDFIAGLFEKKA